MDAMEVCRTCVGVVVVLGTVEVVARAWVCIGGNTWGGGGVIGRLLEADPFRYPPTEDNLPPACPALNG